jgi:DNA-binding transcriptional LysR family regulator
MRITLKQLEVFVSVAKLGSISQAAATLFLSQPACSMALAAIETQLGGELFDRHGKKLLLNERGKTIFTKAANIITQVEELQDVLLGKKTSSLSGHLFIGASSTIGNYLLPEMIGDFVETYPHTKITLQIANTEQVIQQLLKFKIDVGMIEGNCMAEAVEVIPWKKDELIIIAPPKHPLTQLKKLSREDFKDARWILREPGSGTRERFLAAFGEPIVPFLELGHTEAIKKAVQSGLGISCVSRTTVADSLKAKQLVELKTPFLKLTRDFYIVLHQEKHKTATLEAFIKQCKA